MKKLKLSFITLAMLILVISGCSNKSSSTSSTTSSSGTTTVAQAVKSTDNMYGDYDDEDFDESYDESTATKITLDDSGSTIDGDGATESDGTITITAGGTYIISGDYQGQIKVDAGDETVRLVLDNATITNSDSSAIYVEQAAKVITTLAEGSENYLSDGSEYTYASADETEPDATFYSKDDLTINGTGTLTVTGNYSNGIRSKDDLVITNGTINVTAVNNALKGKDSVSIADGIFNLTTTEGDGIQANNSEDTTKGWVAIDGGTFTIQSGNDGIQAETNLSISTADITIKTANGYDDQSIDTTTSYKGLKASGNIVIDDGTYNINTADDSIHSNATVTINGGTFDLSSGDDGVHADTDLVINDGTIDVANSYEGLEGSTVTINDGDITVQSSDDGVNAAGGSDSSTSEGQFGADSFGQSDSSKYIEINGGTLYVSADGDGLDSNGDIRMTAGTVIVNGPTDDGNGALDYDGTFTMDGGTFVESGSSGMAMSASDDSSQAALSLYFNETQAAGTLVNIKNSAGETIASYTASKAFSHIAVSSPDLTVGDTITISTGGSDSGTEKNGLYTGGTYSGGTVLTTVTIDNILTSIDETGAEVSGSQMGGQGGGPH